MEPINNNIVITKTNDRTLLEADFSGMTDRGFEEIMERLKVQNPKEFFRMLKFLFIETGKNQHLNNQ